MEEFNRQIQQLMERWAALSATVRLSVAFVAGLLGLAMIAIIVSNAEPTMAVLFSNLSQDDELRIVERLSTMGVKHSVDDETSTITIPRNRVHEIRLMLATEGLPSGTGIGFEVFDQQRFGESEFSEQVKYHRALEGELGRTISHLSGVRRARVHLVLPKRSLFLKGSQGASASVVLHVKPGWKVRDEQARGIVHLVASSVRSLDSEHVTLVDGEGRKIGGGGDAEVGGTAASDSLSFRGQVERSRQQAAQELLDATMGGGRSVVRVAAEVDFTREERTEETYDPQGVAARSYQISQEGAGVGGPTVGGVPGTPSNLPGGAAPEAGGTSSGSLARRSETRNFEVSKVLKHSIEPVGRVTGLQVAVVVDGTWSGEGDEREWKALSKKELNKIQGLVASAVGINESRGDRVTIESVPFAEVEVYEPSWLERIFGPYIEYIPAALGLILLLIVALIVRKKFGKARAQDEALRLQESVALNELKAAAGELPPELQERLETLEEGQEGAEDPALGTGEETAGPSAESTSKMPSSNELEEIRALASELAGQEPEAAARVIRGWLSEGESV